MKKKIPTQSGVTILELMIAIFILSITSYSLFYGLRTGDTIIGKAKISGTAATLASNEAERVRNAALQNVRLQDSTYSETVSGVKYAVSRQIINASNINTENYAFTEFEIRIAPQGTQFPPYVFKLIQGYCHK